MADTPSEAFKRSFKDFSSIPMGQEALRYAQAGVGKVLPPPKQILVNPWVDNEYRYPDREHPDGLIAINPQHQQTLDPNLPGPSWKSPAYLAEMLKWTTGVLPHELTHYLNNAAVTSRPEMSALAQQRVNELGTYNPMWALPASNQNDNPMEQLAERVAQPYTDAQEVGKRAKPFLQNPQRVMAPKNYSISPFA